MQKSTFMKTLLIGTGALAMSVGAAVSSATADTVLTVSSWASPKHAMNASVFPWMNEQLTACSGGSLSLKVEYGLAPPPAQYDTVRDGVADLTWMVHGYTPGKFRDDKNSRTAGSVWKISGRMSAAAFRPPGKSIFPLPMRLKVTEISLISSTGGMIPYPLTDFRFQGFKWHEAACWWWCSQCHWPGAGGCRGQCTGAKVYETISSGVADGVFPNGNNVRVQVAEIAKHTYRNTDGIYHFIRHSDEQGHL